MNELPLTMTSFTRYDPILAMNLQENIKRQSMFYKYLFVSALIVSSICMVILVPAHGKIHKRVHQDGTVEYYNTAEKKYKSRGKISLSSKYDDIINRIAAKYGMDPYLIKCIIKVESDFNSDAVSVAGAMGLMQIMQETARYYNLVDPFDAEQNLETGIRHFSSLMQYFKNDIPLSLAAYHAGIGRVKKRMALPPIKSTIAYVNRIMLMYAGKGNYESSVKKLYTRIARDGTIIIYSK